MGGVTNSLGGFLGLNGGSTAPQGAFGGQSMNNLLDMANSPYNAASQGVLNNAQNGSQSVQSEIDQAQGLQGLDSAQEQGVVNNLATGPATGSQYATENVQNNPLLSQGLNDIQGQLQTGQGMESQQQGILNNLQSQGFNLQPQDQSLYGQEAGQIANQFGQQANDTANNLASRGLSNSGAAGAQFSGIQGNQNQMLANAQQQIAQQRFQNTQGQIAQQQQFLGQLNSQNNQAANSYSGQASNDVNQQYGRQLSGVENQQNMLTGANNAQTGQNNAQNSYAMGAANFNTANTPFNIGDSIAGGANGMIGGMFGGASTPGASQAGLPTGSGQPAQQGFNANSYGSSGMSQGGAGGYSLFG